LAEFAFALLVFVVFPPPQAAAASASDASVKMSKIVRFIWLSAPLKVNLIQKTKGRNALEWS
jgi:hypothetical protein